MLVSSLRTTTYTYTPVTPTAVDTKKVLFKTTLPNSNSTVDGDAFVYSTQALRNGRAAPSNAVILQNTDGSFFKIDLSANPSSKVNILASSGNLNLYVYNADTKSANQFTFNSTGVMTASADLDARAVSAAEISTKRDLDGNGAIGAKLDKTRLTGGVLDAVGGVFKVKVKDEDLFVVGAGLDRASTINANTSTLLNADGTAWKPDETYVGYSAISAGAGAATTWDIYGRTAGGSVTKFSFDANKKLTGTTPMSFADMAALEASQKRDLNGDGNYGVSDITAVDAKAGLYKGKAFGQDIFLAKSAPTTTAKTAAMAVSTAGTFLSVDGSAWTKPANNEIASMVNTGTAQAPAYSVYTYKSTTVGGVVTPDKNTLLRFDFTADGATGNFKLTSNSVLGVTVTAADMAKAEKDFKRDLNTDGTFGATITTTDIVGAATAVTPSAPIKTLFSAAMIGSTTYVVGNKLSTGVTGDLAKDLSSQLLGRDGNAWTVKANYKVASLVETGNNTYDVYAYKSPAGGGSVDKNDIIKYSFAADGVNFKVTEPTSAGVTVTATALAAAEKTSKSDLNSDGFYGVSINAGLDTTGGLYKATAMGQQYLLVGNSLTSSANAPLDLTNALLGKDGKAWKPENVASVTGASNLLRLVTDQTNANPPVVTGYSVYVKDDSGQFSKYSFDTNKTLTTGPVAQNALDMATAEKATPGRDLDNDSNFGVVFDSTFSAQGDIYKASMLGRTAYIVTTPAPATGAVGSAAQDFSASLQTADGKAWAVKDGYRVTGAVKTSAANATPATYDVYAIKSTTVGLVTTDDTTDVIKYSFTAASGNFTVDADTAAGVKVTSAQLAAVEKSKAANLNADGVFGITIDKTLDNTGGLYVASALGNKFVIVGASNLTATSSNPQDLTKALLNADGTAWMPDTPTTKGALNPMTATNTLSVVSTVSGGNTTYEVYVKDGTTAVGTPTYAKYSFGTDYKMTGNRVDLSTEQVATLEKTLSRDLTGDSKYSVDITDALDSIGGLYKGSLGALTNVYFAADPNLTPGSAVASKAIDFSKALLNVDGSYFTGTGATVLKAFSTATVPATVPPDDKFRVVASITGDATRMRLFTFNNVAGEDKKLLPADSKDLTLIEFAALEKTNTRDLNGDGVIGASVKQTAVDRVGGLFEANIGTNKFLAVATTADTVNTNLSTVLLNKDGTAWSNGAATNTVIKPLAGSAGYDVYTNVAGAYTQYHFDSSYKLDDTKTKTLNTADLAAAEVSIARDINGDNVLGARITNRIDTTAANFLSTATINSTEYVLATTTVPGNSADLSGSMIAKDGSTPWKLDLTPTTGADLGFTLQRVKINQSVGATNSYEVFATKSDGTARRFTFGADRVLQKTADLTKDMFASEIVTPTSGGYDDTVGGLYKATLLGNTFYLQGTAGGTGTAPDLSKTLFTTGGAAWAPGTDYKVGGMVTTVAGGATAYDVYTYKKDSGGMVIDVKKDSWDANLKYLGQTTADTAALVAVETTAAAAGTKDGYGRDLNGDGVVGFKATITASPAPEANYKGVTTAMVGGASSSAIFLIAGKDMTSGNTVGTALKLSDALLNATGTAAWTLPDSGYNITAVDDTGSSRFVYAVKAATYSVATPPVQLTPDLVKKYEFDKTTGKSLGAGVAVSAVDLAAVEKTNAVDLNGDNTIGAVVVSKVTDAADLTRDLGLLKANVNSTDFYVYSGMPTAGAKIDLSKALLNQDGTSWSKPTDFTIKGTYQGVGANDPVEVYGLNSTGGIQQFKFAKTFDAFGTPSTTYTVLNSTGTSGTVNNLTGAQLAVSEVANTKDLNGDGAVGYKITVGTPLALQTGTSAATSFGLGIASVSNGTAVGAVDDQIYVAAANYTTIGKTGGTTTANAALKLDATNYWKLDTGYTIQSMVVDSTAKTLDVYAKNASNNYLKYSFSSATIGTAPWVKTGTSNPTKWDMLTLEVSAPVSRDLNGDTFVGATAVTKVTNANNPTQDMGLIKTTLGGNDLYVFSAMPAAGSNIDLTKALLSTDGTTAWAKPGTLTITGTYQASAADPIEVYGVDTAGATQQYRFTKTVNPFGTIDSTYTLMASTSGGLAGVNSIAGSKVATTEIADTKDLNGDGAIGYKVTSATPLFVQTASTTAATFGMGTAAVSNGAGAADQIYFVGADFAKIGSTASGATSTKDTALKADANNYWKLDSGYTIQSMVVDSTAKTLDVYAKNGSDAFLKYSFSATAVGTAPWIATGKTSPSKWDMLTLEISGSVSRDLNGDSFVGATSVTKVTDANNPTNDVGLIKATLGANDVYVFSAMPGEGANIDLTKALLSQDGTTQWTKPASFTIKGTYQAAAAGSPIEVYGVDSNGATQQYRFTKSINPYGTVSDTYTLMDAKVGSGQVNNLNGAQVATLETTTAINKDLNGDGAIGYKIDTALPSVIQSGSTAGATYGLSTASVSNGLLNADQIYFVGADYAKMTSGATGAMTTAKTALTLSDGTFWKPDTGYTIKSIKATTTTLEVYALDNSGAAPKYLNYSFTSAGVGTAAWVMAATATTVPTAPATTLLTSDILTLEVAGSRDLNADGAVGLRLDTFDTGVYKAHIDNTTYYLFGTDLATGTTTTPLGLTNILKNADGTAWAPAATGTVSGWRTATTTEIAAHTGATNALTQTVAGTPTTIFFDTNHKLVA